MKVYNSQPIKTISIIGSFRKQMNEIRDAKETFEKYGFQVLVPKSTTITGDTDASFVLLDTDTTSEPRKLEKDYLKALIKSDLVYCYNKDGYIGKSAMFELGYLIAKGHMVYFLEQPQEELINDLIADKHTICQPEQLCKKLLIENEIWKEREWFDADHDYVPSFSFDFPKNDRSL